MARGDYSPSTGDAYPRSPTVEAAKHLAKVARDFTHDKAGPWDVEEAYRMFEDARRTEKEAMRGGGK